MGDDDPRREREEPQGSAAEEPDDTTQADAGMAGGTGAVPGEATERPYGTADDDHT
jgi:hypothetical protein